jgi:hypothetical protein
VNADLIAALVARLGGSVELGRKELEATHGCRVLVGKNGVTGDVVLTVEHK